MSDLPTLRPVTTDDLSQLCRLATDPDSLGPDWGGFTNPAHFGRRLDDDGFLSDQDGLLVIDVAGECVGQVSWRAVRHGGPHACWGIGVSVFPEYRGRGYGTTAQRLLVDYLFDTTTVHRIQATTRSDNAAEQGALIKLGFVLEGTLRESQFKAGEWRDTMLFSVLRTDRSCGAGVG